jgi:hypothetical protein
MQWEDIHPGYWLLKIAETIAPKRLFLAGDWTTLRTSINKTFDCVAKQLGWPNFKELIHAMSILHRC